MKRKQITYNNEVIISMDTETTTLRDEKLSYTYIIAVSVGLITDKEPYNYYMKTWYDFKNFLDSGLFDPTKTYVIYVHNLSFEFEFMRSYIHFDTVFCRDSHKIMKCTYKNFEFRCSLFLSNCKLETLAKNENLPVKKLVGDLDYTKIRHTSTYLTDKELQYIKNDILCVWYYIQKKLKQYGNYKELPLTSTGEVRYIFRQKLLSDEKIKAKIRGCVKRYSANTEHLQNKLIKAYAGAYTHGNWMYEKDLISNVSCIDIASSYPYQMSARKFPTNWTKLTDDLTLDEIKSYINDGYAVLADVIVIGMQAKTYHSIFSKHKCTVSEDCITDNGRIRKCAKCIMTLTDIDIELLDNFYEGAFYFTDVYISKKEYLPREIVEIILDLFKQKTALKGIKEQKENYNRLKAFINGIYGTTVFDVTQDEIEFDYETEKYNPKPKSFDDFEKYIKNKNTYLWYSIGVWVTAYARKQLLDLVYCMNTDALYSDTDSIKFLNGNKYTELIQQTNTDIIKEFETAMKYHGFTSDAYTFKTSEGKQMYMGVFEYETPYRNFKYLGAKAYLSESEETDDFEYYTDDSKTETIKCQSKLHSTVAGAPKNLSQYLCLAHFPFFCKPFDFFDVNKTYVSDCKNGHSYHNNVNFTTQITDYTGKTDTVEIKSGVAIMPASFSLNAEKKISDALFENSMIDFDEQLIKRYL